MVTKKDAEQGNESRTISAEEEAALNRELGLTEAATAALVRREGGKLFSDQELRDLVSFEDYLSEFAEQLAQPEDFVGSGAERLVHDEWLALVGKPCAIVQWNFTESAEFNSWFIHVEVIDEHNRRYAFTSGAKFGIRDQLYDYSVKTGKFNHVVCYKGLVDRPWSWTDPETQKTRTIHVPTLPDGVATKRDIG